MKSFHEQEFIQAVVDCIRQTSFELPEDVKDSLLKARDREDERSIARSVLGTIIQNIELAKEKSRPICQDTGLPAFYITYPQSVSVRVITSCVRQAVAQATEKGYLRPNAVDPVSGKNSGTNVGEGIPWIHLEEWDEPGISVKCLLKGGGSENVSAQYSLPSNDPLAGRDLKGVAACVTDAVMKAQGKGCAPGIIAVGIGGDRAIGYLTAKKQLFRNLKDENDDPVLRQLEHDLFDSLNALEIGPMGLGGKTTVLGVKIGTAHRIPASFFVSVAYMCWACRRKEIYFAL